MPAASPKKKWVYKQWTQHNTIIVFDFETGGKDPNVCEPVQVAGKAYNGKTRQPIPAEMGGEFCSLMKPLYFDKLEEEALNINGKTKEMLEVAPDQGVVWNQFVDWVNKYNPKKTGRREFGAPIAAGKNIRFDLTIAQRMNVLHCDKKGETVLFSERPILDVEDDLFRWFHFDRCWDNFKMDTVRAKFGYATENAHDALEDVRQTGHILMRFLNVYDYLRTAKLRDGTPLIPAIAATCSCNTEPKPE